MNEIKYRYSIIIPHYRVPKMLSRCLYSIPKRKDTQVIVVDDNSGNDYIKQLKHLEEEYPNVYFIYSDENGGGGRARNIALKHAVGEYVIFADADDYFNYCFFDILDEYENTQYDIVFFNATHLDAETYLPNDRLTTLRSLLIVYKKNKNLSLFRYIFGEPWCKIIRRAIIEKNKIWFEELPVHNDTRFSYMIGYYASSVKFDNRALYCVLDRTGSVSKQLDHDKQLLRVRVFSEKNSFLRDHNIKIFDYLMLNPFQYYLKRLDVKHLNMCFDISRKYGFSKAFILWKIIVRRLRFLILGEIN